MHRCRIIQDSYKKDDIRFKCFPSILFAIIYADLKWPFVYILILTINSFLTSHGVQF